MLNLSIVIPVYNSEKSLIELSERIKRILKDLEVTYEIIFVNDCSKDRSYAILEELRRNDKRIKIINLAKNFGQHNALVCGFNYTRGEYVITMDDDLQNPPEEIPKLYNKIKEGFDIVIGVPVEKKQSHFRNLGSKWINWLNTQIFKYPKELKLSSYRIIRKQIIEKICSSYSTPYCYIPAYMFRYVSNDKITNVEVKHDGRKYGTSNYSLIKLISLSSNLFINNSDIPLRMGIRFGFIISILCIIYGLYIFIRQLFGNAAPVQGWASIAALITFLFGVLFIYLGIISEYIYRILVEISRREQFIIQEMYLDD